MTLESVWCRITGHDWELPVYEGGKRVERCVKCAAVRDRIEAAAVGRTQFTQADLDGGTTVTVVVTPRAMVVEPTVEEVDAAAERKARLAAICAKVKEKHSGGLSTERVQ